MLPPLQTRDNGINCVAISPDGSKIVSGSQDTNIRVWDASTGVEMLPLPLRGHNNAIESVAFSPDGSKIISGSYHDSNIRVWDACTGTLLPHPQVATDGFAKPAIDEPMIREWLTNIDTGSYMGALPVDARFHSGQVRGSIYFGWTAGFKLIIIHFPEQ